MQEIKSSGIKTKEDEQGCDPTLRFGIQTIWYTAIVTRQMKMSSSVYMITCVQKNLSRLWWLFPMIKGNYFNNSYNKFVLTKATQGHRWNKLGEHILFYTAKHYFFVAGEGLSNAATTTVLSESVTHLGQMMTLRNLLTSKEIFSFIQHSQAGGCKIICQHDDPTIIQTKGKPEVQQHPQHWFTTHVIRAEKDPAKWLDWSKKKFEQRWPYKDGTTTATTTNNKSMSDNIRKFGQQTGIFRKTKNQLNEAHGQNLYHNAIFGYSTRKTPAKQWHQPGGAMIASTGTIAAWHLETRFDTTGMRRYSYQKITGTNGRMIIFMAAYRVCKDSIATAGETTLFFHQWQELTKCGHKHPNPIRKNLNNI
jgi:hypothetical protein